MSQDLESSLVTWSVPQCPFTIDCSPRVLDEIRLAVIDAFFSLPRGGAEIGGVLMGYYSSGRLSVVSHRPLECEHAFGPSFTLSEPDFARLRDLLGATAANPAEPQPVGWYHSHTRSEIFLSPADCQIHDRFFSRPWQVALVLKPHTFQPTRAGFFFREAGGHIHAGQSYQEILLDALPGAPTPTHRSVAPPPPPVATPAPIATPRPPIRATPPPLVASLAPIAPIPATPPAPLVAMAEPHYEPAGPLIGLDGDAEAPVEEAPPPPVPAPEPLPEPPPAPPPIQAAPTQAAPAAPEDAAFPPPPQPAVESVDEEQEPPQLPEAPMPRFLAVEPQPPSHFRTWAGLALGLAVLAGCGYVTRGLWWDETMGSIESTLSGGRPPALKLHALDAGGQLQIQWDPHSRALRKPHGARLTIVDGSKVRGIPLDLSHLASGTYTYARESGKVDVSLAITDLAGQVVREQTTYLGLPIVTADTGAGASTDAVRGENERLKADLAKEREKSSKQDKQIRYLQNQLEKELRLKRLEKQLAPDK